jgi:hypothetical protein
MFKIKGLYADLLFGEFTSLKSTFKPIPDRGISLFDQTKAFRKRQSSILVTNDVNGNNEDDGQSTVNKTVRSDRLWLLLISLTLSSNFTKNLYAFYIHYLATMPMLNQYSPK